MKRLVTPLCSLLLAATLLPVVAHAQTATAIKPSAAKPAPLYALTPSPMPLVSGLLAFIDPETGLLGGPIFPLVAPSDLASSAAAIDPVEVRLPDGSYMMDLQGGGMDYLVLHIDALGKKTLRCVHGLEHAHQTLTVAPIVPVPVER